LRLTGLDEPAELDETFDRPTRFYRPQPARLNPWSAGHPDPLRVAVIGDSFTDGQGNHGYDAYPARLEALLNLNAEQRPVEVRAYAERGSTTHGQLKLLRRAVEWGADLVILGIFLNDAERAGDPALLRRLGEMRPRVPQGRLAWVLRRSAALAWIYQRLENLRCSRAVGRYWRQIYDPDYEGFKLFEQAIRRFRHQTEQAGIAFLPVILPGMATLGPEYASHFAHERIHAVLEAEGQEYLDLLEAFSRTAPGRMSAFATVDPHPSEIAHRIAADEIFHRLLDAGLVEPGYRPQRVETKTRKQWLRELRRVKSVVHLIPDE
jgi:lysophospholipase L1-like esterase